MVPGWLRGCRVMSVRRVLFPRRLRTRGDAATAGSALVPANGNLHRGRERDADAACPALHPQPSAGHRRAGVLVLDVGVAGALLAAPMLATFKIVCDRISPLTAPGRLLRPEARPSANSPPL